MIPLRIDEVAALASGEVEAAGGQDEISGVQVDSRRISPGDLFVAVGRGVEFRDDALARGAAAALVPTDAFVALAALGAAVRQRSSARVVGITGSTGKTITKDLTAAVLGRRFRVVASPASFNNEVGLPLTLLQADDRTEAVVCEMGSRGPGHIRLLCEVAAPTVGVVTNVGEAHMELFGSPEALRDAKAELPEALPAGRRSCRRSSRSSATTSRS